MGNKKLDWWKNDEDGTIFEMCKKCDGTGACDTYNGLAVCNKCRGTGFALIEDILKLGWTTIIKAMVILQDVRTSERVSNGL